MAIGEGEVLNEMMHFGRGLTGLVREIFQGMADFVEWVSGQGGVHGRPHPGLVEDIPMSPRLPLHVVGMEDVV